MGVLSDLKPARVFKYFEDITRIPHGSYNIDAISDYLVDFAKEHQLRYAQDEAKNVIMWKDATPGYENSRPVMLQGHMDMVAVKTADCDKDMEKDGLDVAIDGDYVYAKGTSLGGDDGIAVAYALAVLEDDSIPHPPIEVLITTNEEVGLLGADAVDVSQLKSNMIMNIDSEAEGIFTISCAGGGDCDCYIRLPRQEKNGREITIRYSGLRGGHSGAEIHLQRMNASVAILRTLLQLSDHMDFEFIRMAGGEKDNAITVDSEAVIAVDSEKGDEAVELLCQIGSEILNVYDSVDPDAEVEIDDMEKMGMSVVPAEETRRIVSVLANVPYGVQRMDPNVPGLVQTSLNLGIVTTDEDALHVVYSVRSSVDAEKALLLLKIRSMISLAGGKTEVTGEYPGWEYNPNSHLLDVMVEDYKEQYGCEPKVEGIHAGLECGLFAEKIADLDAVSIGPDMLNIHTTGERLSISSVERTWELILNTLKKLK